MYIIIKIKYYPKNQIINKNNIIKFNISDDKNKIYKIEAICDNRIYIKESELSYLLRLYYLIF